MHMLVFGACGYLGGRFLELFPGAVASPVDIADQVAVRHVLDTEKPEVVINCAGKTGKPNVDWCEDHKEETIRANVTGPLVLLDACVARRIRLVHVSSGCIYAGDNGGAGFSEEDPPNFTDSFYSRSKTWSDQILKEFPVLMLRLRMPFDGTHSDRNLLMKIRRYPRVLDAQNSLSHLPDFLHAAKILIERGRTGVYNVVNPGTASPFRIMQMYREIVDPSHAFERLAVEDLGQVAKAGRSNCLLSTRKLEEEGIRLAPVEKMLEKCLRQIAAEERIAAVV